VALIDNLEGMKMKRKKFEVGLYKSRWGFDSIFQIDMSGDSDYVLIGKGTASIEMLEHKDVVKAQVESLEKTKTEVRAKYQLEIERIDGEIQSLLAITHNPDGA
jgi:hypothetical protein